MDTELLDIKRRLVGCTLNWTDTGREPSTQHGGFTIENVVRDVHHPEMLLISGTNGEWRVWHVDAVRHLLDVGTHTVVYNTQHYGVAARAHGLTPPPPPQIVYTLNP